MPGKKGEITFEGCEPSTLFRRLPLAARAGSVRRVPAPEIEALVIKAVRHHLKPSEPTDDRSLVHTHVARVEVQPDRLSSILPSHQAL